MRTIALVLVLLAGCLQAPSQDAEAEAPEAWPEVLPSTATINLPLDSTVRMEVNGQGWGQLRFHGSGLLDVRLKHSVFRYDRTWAAGAPKPRGDLCSCLVGIPRPIDGTSNGIGRAELAIIPPDGRAQYSYEPGPRGGIGTKIGQNLFEVDTLWDEAGKAVFMFEITDAGTVPPDDGMVVVLIPLEPASASEADAL